MSERTELERRMRSSGVAFYRRCGGVERSRARAVAVNRGEALSVVQAEKGWRGQVWARH